MDQILDARTANPTARGLARVLKSLEAGRRTLVISPPTSSYELWSATLLPGGHRAGAESAWSWALVLAGSDIDYTHEHAALEQVLDALIDEGPMAPLAVGEVAIAAMHLERILEDGLGVRGLQLELTAPLGERGAGEGDLIRALEEIAGRLELTR